VVAGAHELGRAGAGKIPIWIEAGPAFGTGHHGTTKGCLESLARVARSRRLGKVLDIGTGSGVLAIAALKAGADSAIASDIDPESIRIARENAKNNRMGRTVRFVVATGAQNAAIRGGASLWNGCHTPLVSDPEIAAAVRPGVYVWDMRREPAGLRPGSGAARNLACKRVLFVGTDMNIGKMTAALEFDREAKARGVRSAFIGTGQTGMMICGSGMCLDAVRVDYASGAVEAELMRDGPGADVVWVEGQGSMLNPASTATLPLLRGTQPTHLVLVHKAGMKHLHAFPHVTIPPLKDVVEFYERVATAAGALAPAKVLGIALNTWGLDDATARAEIAATAAATGLPTTDAVRYGTSEILDAILAG
jgi:uncharacterized NAD-dependent epimerase/dehydratase family protein